MNDDILLTSEERYEVEKRGTERWQADKAEPKLLRRYINEAICRAQVRKVVEWMQAKGVMVYERQLGFVLPALDWQALKAAGEEK